jgi:hypothetical protein
VVSGSAGKHPVLAELNLEGLHYEPATLEMLLTAWIQGVSDTVDEGAALAAFSALSRGFAPIRALARDPRGRAGREASARHRRRGALGA